MAGRLSRFFPASYRLLGRHRVLFLSSLALLLALFAAGFLRLAPGTDMRRMLPDGDPALLDSLSLLEESPLSRKLLIDVARDPAAPRSGLPAAADRLAAALGSPDFTRVLRGPVGEDLASGLLPLLAASLPSLATSADLAEVEARLSPVAVGKELEKGYSRLLSPEGVVVKEAILGDPLSFREVAFAKLSSLNLLPRARISGGGFLSPDGDHALIIAGTPVPVTDPAGSERLLNRLERAVREAVPPGFTVTVVGGHPYAVANARAIKRDLAVIYGFASLAILGLVILFLRSWQAILVFLVPAAVVLPAALAVERVFGSVSALTIGFGSVLMDISVDYSTHTWFALRKGRGDRSEAMGEIARPVVFGGLTTMCGFSVLLFSALPGQREIAVFTLAGIALALLLALFFLPQVASFPPPRPSAGVEGRLPPPHGRRGAIAVWLLVLAVLAWQAGRLRFDGDLRSLTLVTGKIAAGEETFRKTWGQPGSRALVAVEGVTVEEALGRNDLLYATLSRNLPPGEIVSLAPLCPAPATQAANRERWSRFWSDGRAASLRASLSREGDRFGFSAGAFDGFLAALSRPGASSLPAPLALGELRRSGLGDLIDLLVLPREGRVQVLTLLPDTPGTASLLAAPGALPPGTRFASADSFRRAAGRSLTRDFTRFLAGALAAMSVLLLLLYRDLRRPLLALIPVATGLLFMFGSMGALGMPFNLYNVVASVLVIGLAIDYGIFMVAKTEEGADHDTDRAILLNGLTTLAGFGSLVLASHPALHSIGVTVLLGVGAAFPAALLVIPAFARPAPCPGEPR